jgi:hypothetical protein
VGEETGKLHACFRVCDVVYGRWVSQLRWVGSGGVCGSLHIYAADSKRLTAPIHDMHEV